MSKSPILRMESKGKLSLQAGGGVFGCGGVVIYDQECKDGRPSTPTALQDGYNQGFALPYNSCAFLYVDNEKVWVNNILLNNGERQDFRKRGILDLRLFRSEDLEKFIEEHRRRLENLGIKVR